MIAGTFVFEDQSIQFCALKDGRIEYTVQDALSGVSATKSVDMLDFGAAMHLALIGDDNADDRMYALATDAMPCVHDVHEGDEMAQEDVEAAVRALRWIP